MEDETQQGHSAAVNLEGLGLTPKYPEYQKVKR